MGWLENWTAVITVIQTYYHPQVCCRFLAETYAKNHAHMAKNDHPPCDASPYDAFANQG